MHLKPITQEGIPAAEFFARLGKLFERHADKIDAMVIEAKPADRAKLEARVRESRAKAGDAYIAYSRAQTLRMTRGMGRRCGRGSSCMTWRGICRGQSTRWRRSSMSGRMMR